MTIYPITQQSFMSHYDLFTVGAGYLDIWAAPNNADVANGAAMSPTAIYNPLTNTVSLALARGRYGGTGVVWVPA